MVLLRIEIDGLRKRGRKTACCFLYL